MEKLMELIEIVSTKKLKKLDIPGRSDSTVDQLFNLIEQGKIRTDEEALSELFSNSESKSSLYLAKRKLYEKLLDFLLIIDISEKYHIDFNRIGILGRKRTSQLENLLAKHSDRNIIPIGESILKLAQKYKHVDVLCRVLPILMKKAIFISKNEQKMQEYRRMYEKYHAMQELQNLAGYYWLCIAAKFVDKRFLFDERLLRELKNYTTLLKKKLKKEHTCITLIHFANLCIREKEILNDYKSVIKLTESFYQQAIKYIDASPTFNYHLLNKKLSAEITLHRFAEAYNTGIECLKNIRVGHKNWFTLQDNLITLCLHDKKYDTAFKICRETTSHRQFKFLSPWKKETFTVYRAFLQFFINTGLLIVPDDKPEKHKFRVSKFNNEVPIFSKDKEGFNITILIIQFLLLFTEEKYDKAYDKISSVKEYSKKHLKNDSTYRSYCFLKMLVKLVECNYHKAATISKTNRLYQKLKSRSSDIQRTSNHVEIAPFEHLWKIILDRIDNRFRGTFNAKKDEKRTKV